MTEYDPRKVRRARCPQCGAQPGKPCVTKTGRRFTAEHHVLRRGVVYPRFLLGPNGGPKRGLPIPKAGGA